MHLKIHELTGPDGELIAVYLRRDGDGLALVELDRSLALPSGALKAVMERYGAPFDPAARVQVIGELSLPDGATLRHVRHLAGYDVIARDYLVYGEEGGEALCAMATNVAGALSHLALATLRLK